MEQSGKRSVKDLSNKELRFMKPTAVLVDFLLIVLSIVVLSFSFFIFYEHRGLCSLLVLLFSIAAVIVVVVCVKKNCFHYRELKEEILDRRRFCL